MFNSDKKESPVPLTISLKKLAILSVTSLGFYDFYWFYKQWKALQHIKKSNISPIGRAVFSKVFAYLLFKEYFKLAKQETHQTYPWPSALAFAYIIPGLLSQYGRIFWIFTFASAIPLIPAQKAINDYAKAKNPALHVSDTFSWYEKGIILTGSILILLALVKIGQSLL